MKVKALSLVAGAIALTLAATPFAVKAQSGFSSHRLVAQATNGQVPHNRKGPWAELGLTDTQKSQIQTIQRDTRNQIEQLILQRVNFTQEQKDKLNELKAQRGQWQRGQRQAGQQRGQGSKRGFAALNLTEEQKNQLKQVMQSSEVKQIRQSSQQKIQALLTPEQRTKLQQLRENARARWQQRRNQGTTP
ncbi:hypothetical protein [Nostoc sp. 106C]|uniref:Spy/CpxP family protein refolding chaperone n=1 Tax=Nostoc sp. 106C TaxID=1932667 RepID=UPI000A39C603|nr:hypothetical protein [Nostoc sp. 106C]OUL21030.1 hypothetical protein BV378_27615 [Nostoc sp. RF31YmG]OUL23581.1 hypothetical protein BV375_25955 [Nostoc sp. 106C]